MNNNNELQALIIIGYYFLGLVGAMLYLLVFTALTCLCDRNESSSTPYVSEEFFPDPQENPSRAVEIGIHETTLQNYPTLLYSKALLENTFAASCCSICLSDYKNSDEIGQLPHCGHVFHLRCVDPWLQLHPNCPVCRSTPASTPLSIPVAEAVPLARQQVRNEI